MSALGAMPFSTIEPHIRTSIHRATDKSHIFFSSVNSLIFWASTNFVTCHRSHHILHSLESLVHAYSTSMWEHGVSLPVNVHVYTGTWWGKGGKIPSYTSMRCDKHLFLATACSPHVECPLATHHIHILHHAYIHGQWFKCPRSRCNLFLQQSTHTTYYGNQWLLCMC